MKLRKESIAGMLLVAVSASVMVLSVIFTYKTNCEKLGNAIAMIFSCAIVIFNTIALTVASLFLRQKTFGSIIVAVMLLCIFVFTTGYSITNTMNIMYEGNKETAEVFIEKQTNIDGSRAVLDLKKQLVADKEVEIAEKNKAIESKEADIVKYDSMEGYPTRAFQARQARDKLIEEKSLLLKEKQELNREIEQLMKETPQAVTETTTKKQDSVYAYYASLFDKDENTVRNAIDAIPAFFLDLIAPITMSLAVYFFGDKKKKLIPEVKKEEKSEPLPEPKEPVIEYKVAEKPTTRDAQIISILERLKNRAENAKPVDEASLIRAKMLKDDFNKLYEYKNKELYEKVLDKQEI
ncbi:MAG: hypothetical protein M0R23_10065 [Bacteroidales bacterium]|nr:hypothetical protein [Bacteroidales bacterium]